MTYTNLKNFVKKLSSNARRRNLRHARLLGLRKRISVLKVAAKRRALLASKHVTIHRDGNSETVKASNSFKMPSIMCLEENFEETTKVLSSMHHDVLTKKPTRIGGKISGYWDFTSIKYMSPTVALVLASIYDRRKFIVKSKLFSVDEHLWAPQVSALLREMGFQEFLEMKAETDQGNKGNIRVLRLCSGDIAAGKGPGELQAALAALLPDDEGQKLLYVEPYSGMFEAILNSHMWAYPKERNWSMPQPKRWWLTGAVDTGANLVTVIAYDQGVSIPAMLPAWKHYGRLRSYGARIGRIFGLNADLNDPANDGLAIRLAMTVAKTSTGLPQHGKGLHTMVEVAERAAWGKLRVLSRNGEFTWETGRKSAHRNFDHPIEGTLIEWRLQL